MQKTIFSFFIGLAILSLTSIVSAQHDAFSDVKMNTVNSTSAASIDFAQELGLHFPGLTSLGSRIQTAINSSAPVELAACGLELKAAETAAERTAAIPSSLVLAKAAEMAITRLVPEELKAMKVLIPEKSSDFDNALNPPQNVPNRMITVRVHNNSRRMVQFLCNGHIERMVRPKDTTDVTCSVPGNQPTLLEVRGKHMQRQTVSPLMHRAMITYTE